MSYKKSEHSVRRNINNALTKSSILNAGGFTNKNGTLKRFVPNKAICLKESNNTNEKDNAYEQTKAKGERNIEDENKQNEKNKGSASITTSYNKYDIKNNERKNDEIGTNEIHLKAPKEQKIEKSAETSTKYNKKQLIDKELKKIINCHLGNKQYEQDVGQLEQKLKKDKIKSNSIDAYELNDISKNIYYNKETPRQSDYFVPLTLPFFKESEKKEEQTIRNMFLDKQNFFFNVQLPNMLPCTDEEEIKTDPKEQNKAQGGNAETRRIKNKKYTLSNVNCLPSGKFAKIIIYKNKKIKMKIGDILFDVDDGTTYTFSQEVACHIKDNSEFLFLGNCDRKIVVTPNVENMIQKT